MVVVVAVSVVKCKTYHIIGFCNLNRIVVLVVVVVVVVVVVEVGDIHKLL